MKYDCKGDFRNSKLKAYNQNYEAIRNVDPEAIRIPPGYRVDIFTVGLDVPIDMVFSEDGVLFVADSGVASGNPKILRLANGYYEIIAENFSTPITGINYLDGNIYISHNGYITILRRNGSRQDIISGLPCNGDYGVSNVAFGPDGKLYFGLGTVTNSGVVGPDNLWIFNHPLLHDEPAFGIMLMGQNFETDNIMAAGAEKVLTGAYSSYGVTNEPNEMRKGVLKKASGSILRANRDGTQLELVAWGIRNPIRIKFDRQYRLLAVNRNYDVRGSRPIANAPDEFHYIMPGVWYGWPDYVAGEPVTSPRFQPEGGAQPEFLLAEHPSIPPRPYAEFPPHSSIRGFDIDYTGEFGPYGNIYFAEYGSLGALTMGPSAPYAGIGHRISKLNVDTREIDTFINNKTGLPALTVQDPGFGRLVDITFGPDRAMYVLDIGISDPYDANRYIPNTGVIWRITRTRSYS